VKKLKHDNTIRRIGSVLDSLYKMEALTCQRPYLLNLELRKYITFLTISRSAVLN